MCDCSACVGPMWRTAKSVMEPPRDERGHWLPVCHAARTAGQPLQRCLSRPVRVPERFRGCCPFGARGYAETLPAGVISICDLTLSRAQMVGRVAVNRLAGAAQAPLSQVILEPGPAGRHRDEAILGPDGGQYGQVTLDLAPD